jgi:hypothetical protein
VSRSSPFETGSGHFEVWSYLLRRLDGLSILLGYGIGTCVPIIRAHMSIFNSHSTYFDTIFEGGMILLFLLLSLQSISLCEYAWKLYKSDHNMEYITITIIGIFILMASVSAIMVGLFWLFLAILSVEVSKKQYMVRA